MNERLVVFDLGSTLVQGSPGHPATRIAQRLGMTPDQRAALNEALMTQPFAGPAEVAAHLRTVLGDRANEAVDALIHEVWAAQEGEAEPVEGALEALTALAGHGYRLALLSNIWQPYRRSIERTYGAFFAEHVPPELQFFSYRQGSMKPARSLFRRLLATAEVRPEDAVMVGDSYQVDVAPALDVGMKAIWVLQRPDREVASLVAVLNRAAAAPSVALASVTDLDAAVLASIWGDEALAASSGPGSENATP